mgnify:CR=1 FL=1
MSQVIKYRIFRQESLFIITKQKVATRFLGKLFGNEGHELTLSNTFQIEHIDMLGGDKKQEKAIKDDWKEILNSTYGGKVLLLIRDPKKRFATAQTQDFSDVISQMNDSYLVKFAFTSYWNRKFKKNTTFLTKLQHHSTEGFFDEIVKNADGTYDIDAYNLFKDLFFDWVQFRHDSSTLNSLHSENYLFSYPMLLNRLSKDVELDYDILNIDDPTVSLKNYMKSYTDVDALEGQEDAKQEGKELKRIFLDLVKENKEVQEIMNGALQNEQFVYDMFKYHDKAIKNNATI